MKASLRCAVTNLTLFLKRFRADESGATAVEYGLICSLIFLAVVPVMGSVADKTINMYGIIEGAM
jgi:pilus assembly protein Flp/PilA